MPSLRTHTNKLLSKVKPGDTVRLQSTIGEIFEFEFVVESVFWDLLIATEPVFVDNRCFNPRGETEFPIIEGFRIMYVNGEKY